MYNNEPDFYKHEPEEPQRPRKPEIDRKKILAFLIKILVSSLAVIITAHFMHTVEIADYTTAIVVAVVLAVLNTLLKPALILLTIPVTVMSLGLFLLVINAFIIQLTAYFVSGFAVKGFWAALFFSIILSVITAILELPGKTQRYPKQ